MHLRAGYFFFFRKRTYVCIMHALENKPSSCMNIYVDVLWELSFINYSTRLPSSLLQKTCVLCIVLVHRVCAGIPILLTDDLLS